MRYRRRAKTAAAVSIALTALVALVLLPGGATADSSGSVQPQTPNPGQFTNLLLGVAGVSSSDVWAVGSYDDESVPAVKTLILHWNGDAWSQVSSPNPSPKDNELLAVRAVSAHNVWAVGRYRNSFDDPYLTLTEHWDGKTWTAVPSPSPSSTNNGLESVNGGGSGSGVWAVGYYTDDATGVIRTLALQWTGGAWVRKGTPSPDGTQNVLYGVRVPSSTNAWAVGQAGPESLILHWNGSKWVRVPSPNPSPTTNVLTGTSGASPSDGWAVGYESDGGQFRTLTEHWNGSKWSVVNSPDPGIGADQLFGVRAISVKDAWAVGRYQGENQRVTENLILHWNGSRWAPAFAPDPGASNQLTGIGAISASDAWAVGYYVVNGTTAKTLALHWNGTAWTQK